MFDERVLKWSVSFPRVTVDKHREALSSLVMTKILKQIKDYNADESGYILAITEVISMGPPDNKFGPEVVRFPFEVCCRTFMPKIGEFMTGIVTGVTEVGVFLRSVPMNMIYISGRKMPGYHFVTCETPGFVREDLSKVRNGVVIRFVILDVRWDGGIREFRALASIDGDGLGPVSCTSGEDESDFV